MREKGANGLLSQPVNLGLEHGETRSEARSQGLLERMRQRGGPCWLLDSLPSTRRAARIFAKRSKTGGRRKKRGTEGQLLKHIYNTRPANCLGQLENRTHTHVYRLFRLGANLVILIRRFPCSHAIHSVNEGQSCPWVLNTSTPPATSLQMHLS